MLKIFLVILLALMLIIGIYGIFVFYHVSPLVKTGRTLASQAKPYEQHPAYPSQRFLFIGDSTALGVGASSPATSVAGLFGRDFPDADITNRGSNGERAHGLLEKFHPNEDEQYDLIVIQCGGNDILRLSNLDKAAEDLSQVMDRAKKHARQVVLLHTGDVGNVPFFSFPATRIMHMRTVKLRDDLMKITSEKGVVYIDLYLLEKQDSRSGRLEWFAEDQLHPSDMSYAFWYQSIRNALLGKISPTNTASDSIR